MIRRTIGLIAALLLMAVVVAQPLGAALSAALTQGNQRKVLKPSRRFIAQTAFWVPAMALIFVFLRPVKQFIYFQF